MELLQTILFLVTFYFTIVVAISKLKWFAGDFELPTLFTFILPAYVKDKESLSVGLWTVFAVLLDLSSWLNQIYFWFNKFDVSMTL